MPDVATTTLLENLLGRVNVINTVLTRAITAVEMLQDCKNFPVDRDEAVQAIDALVQATGIPTIDTLKQLGHSVECDAKRALYEDWAENQPVTGAGLVQVNSWLPTDQMEQYAYLDPFKYASAVHEADSIEVLCQTVHPRNYMHVEPNEMHAREVLTRTYGYIQTLKDEGEDDWVWAAFRVGCDAAEIFETSIQSQLNDMSSTIGSSEMQQLAIATIDNPATMDRYIACVEHMMDCLRRVHKFNGVMRDLVDFYKELHTSIVQTREAVGAAYKCYLDDTAISF